MDRPKRQRKAVDPSKRFPGSEDPPTVSRPAAAPREREAGPMERWVVYYRKLQTMFKTIRYNLAFVETYETSGWKSANAEKSKPVGELLQKKKTIVEYKQRMRSLLRDLDAEASDCTRFNTYTGKSPSTSRKEAGKYIVALKKATAEATEDTAIDAEEIACSKCGRFDADDDDDILLCDYSGCGLAMHMRCCDPPFTEPPAEDEDWLCRRCLCLVKCITAINEEFECNVDRWDDLFANVDEEAEDVNAQLAAWEAAENIRKSKLRGTSKSKPNNGVVTGESEETTAEADSKPARPIRASAAAARIIISHKVNRPAISAKTTPGDAEDELVDPDDSSDKSSSAASKEESAAEDDADSNNGAPVALSPSNMPDDSDDEDFDVPSGDSDAASSESEDSSSEDDEDGDDDGGGTDGEAGVGRKRRRREMSDGDEDDELEDGELDALARDELDALSMPSDDGEDDAGDREPGQPMRSRRLAKKARVDYISLNQQLFDAVPAKAEEYLDDETEWKGAS